MKYVKYLRVSTTKQEHTGLGLDEQSDVIDYFVRGGEIIATFVGDIYRNIFAKVC